MFQIILLSLCNLFHKLADPWMLETFLSLSHHICNTKNALFLSLLIFTKFWYLHTSRMIKLLVTRDVVFYNLILTNPTSFNIFFMTLGTHCRIIFYKINLAEFHWTVLASLKNDRSYLRMLCKKPRI